MGSLYLHVPFCVSKCPYCDFYSQVGTQAQIDAYVELLKLNVSIIEVNSRPTKTLTSVFFGGGTPSLLNPSQIGNLLQAIDLTIGIALDAEISLEANPGTINLTQLQGYRSVGVNRLSIGVQSFDDCNLRLLGRIHSADEAQAAIGAARTAGFDNLNLDLMFALPGQELAALDREITAILNYEPEHISLYGLSFESGTAFATRLAAGDLAACKENLYAEHYKLLHRRLLRVGFEHYEISNFAHPGKRSRHNQVYWRRGRCMAAGAGGHSFDASGWGERRHIPADVEKFRESLQRGKDPSERLEVYDKAGAMREFAYLALRTVDGIERAEFKRRFGSYPEKIFASAMNKCGNYLRLNDNSYHFELEGWLLYDHFISHFL